MIHYQFDTTFPLLYHYAGKFQAPNSEWMHLTRQLMDFELIVVTEGTLYIAANERKYTVQTGEYLLMAPVCHQYGYRAGVCAFYWMHFGNTQTVCPILEQAEPKKQIPSHLHRGLDCSAENNTTEPTTPPFMPSALIFPEHGTLPTIERIIILMKQLQDSDRRYGLAPLNNFLASAILSELAAQTENCGRYTQAKETQLFNDIRDYIELHVSEQLKVSAIADYFGYNDKYLSTMFRQWAGIPIKQYILQVKIDHAKAELSDTNRPISQIGYSLGYNDPHNFTNAFKKLTGLAPGDYRKSFSKRRLNEE